MLSAALLAALLGMTDDPAPTSEGFFETRVRPVLAGSCVKCHGPDKQGGGLRLDRRASLLEGGDSGPAIVPGDAAGSLLVQATSHTDDVLKMPPDGPLPDRARADLAAWIDAGAAWPEAGPATSIEAERHWAFQPLRPINPPADPSGWASQPIDRLIAAGHRETGVTPVAPADRRTLIRRVTFDLTGLPPTPERVESFVTDNRPDAYERLVEELLASPRYGERWGRYWLDLARYADTAGDNSDYPIPEAYLYRDYVIDAFNADLPYDRFLHEQIAGDVLALEGPREDYARRVIATGFVAQAKRFGTFKLEDMHQIIEDSLNTTGQVVLGLSLRCARCHDHKYDPVTSKDYYALYGFFAGAKYPFAGAEEVREPSEFAPLIPPDEAARLESEHAAKVESLKAALRGLDGEAGADVARLDAALAETDASTDSTAVGRLQVVLAELGGRSEERARRRSEAQRALAALEKAGALAGVPHAYALRDGDPTDARLQVGGDPSKLGDVVPRGFPAILNDGGGTPDLPATGSGRLALARWLTDGPPRALTARVMVNRIWQHHFGRPIVPTPSDFGLRGTPPTHPDLLEWLAADFVASGWSIKAMHRRILMSETYRLASDDDSANAAVDTGNASTWRFDRRALDAEALRDTLLALGGNLRLDRPGPHPFPPKEQWRYTAHHQFKALYPSDHRSVYLMVQRLHPHPYLSLFNGPDTSVTTAMRDRSTVALQALFLLNNRFVHEQATRFARRVTADQPDAGRRLDRLYALAYARPPRDDERARAAAFLARYEQALADDGTEPEARPVEAWAALARALLTSNEFVYVD
jgi:cytochrome c553